MVYPGWRQGSMDHHPKSNRHPKMMRPNRPSIWKPPTDLYEVGDQLVVQVEVAGMQIADFDIVLENRLLTIQGVRGAQAEPRAYHQLEIGFGEFYIELELPEPVDPERVEAVYRHGFLQIQMQKAASQRVTVRKASERDRSSV